MDSPKRIENSTGQVVEYLKSHPDFFREYPSLLRELSIPHEVGAGVASLIERQVTMLRSHCTQLQQELDLRKTRAGLQRTMLQNLQNAMLRLLRCNTAGEIYASALKSIKRDYDVDEFRIFIFSDEVASQVVDGVKFLARTAKLKYLFIELLSRSKPLCGSLQDEHIRMLFQAAGGHVNSTLIIPLRHARWEGLVALGSHERGRYSRGLEMEMLQHLFVVLGIRLDQIITQPTA
ncbi:MAG: DUF484 family protein [Gammaproteobacteria bacterium]|nr:DUF484 family protein [Gammaproteobacteria bacterium]